MREGKTKDYGIFKKAVGNRVVEPRRVKRLAESIGKYGFIGTGIIVNSDMEVIDGQHRLKACEMLGIEVPYLVMEDAGLEEMIALNTTSKSWGIKQYVDAYAENGNVGYQWYKDLLNRYPKFESTVIENALLGSQKLSRRQYTAGDISVSQEDYLNAIQILDWLSAFDSCFSKMPGRRNYHRILVWCYKHPEINNERMADSILKYGSSLPTVCSIADAISQLDRIYNAYRRSKTDLIHLYRLDTNMGRKKRG